MSCLNSLSSSVTLIYTVPIDIQPSNGDTSIAAQIPQKANNNAMAIIKRLSVERFFCINNFINSPKTPPKASTPRFFNMGRIISQIPSAAPVEEETATEIAILYANNATISS